MQMAAYDTLGGIPGYQLQKDQYYNPPPASGNGIKLNASPDTLRQYMDALKLIDGLNAEQVRTRLPQAQSQLAAHKAGVVSAQKVLEGMQAQMAKEAKDVEKVTGGWYPGKLIKGKDQHAARVTKEQQELEEAQRQVDAQQAELVVRQHDLAAAAAGCQALEHKVSQLSAAEAYEAHVVESLFKGAAGDNYENALEADVDSIKPQMDQIGCYKMAYAKAEALLTSASKNLQQSEQAFEQAVRMARADVVQDVFSPSPLMNGPGGIMIDVAKRRHMQMGEQLLVQAAKDIMEAKHVLPSMPYIDEQKAQAHSMPGVGMDMVFDNMLTDMRTKALLNNQLQDVKALAGQVRQAEAWVQQWLHGRIASDYAALEGEYRMKKGQLDAHRRQLLQQVVAGQAF